MWFKCAISLRTLDVLNQLRVSHRPFIPLDHDLHGWLAVPVTSGVKNPAPFCGCYSDSSERYQPLNTKEEAALGAAEC